MIVQTKESTQIFSSTLLRNVQKLANDQMSRFHQLVILINPLKLTTQRYASNIGEQLKQHLWTVVYFSILKVTQ